MSCLISDIINDDVLNERKCFILPVIDMYKNMDEYRKTIDKVS
jgi:hypothetical protein